VAEKSDKEITVTKAEGASTPAVYNPFQDMERLFEDFMGRGWMRPMRWDRPLFSDFPSGWMPSFDFKGMAKVDVIDRDEEITVRAELPGVEKENVKVTLSGNLITIKGEAKRQSEEEKGEVRRSEIYRGSYQRTFTLPSAVDESRTKATMKDGILEIVMPKTGSTKRHSIKVE